MILKIRTFAFILLFVMVVVTIFSMRGSMGLNMYAIQSRRADFSEISSPINPEFSESDQVCHIMWLQSDRDLSKLLACSPLYMDMIHDLAPADAALAAKAHTLYPELAGPIYWLADSNGGYGIVDNHYYYEQIIKDHPKEGLAWCYLGHEYEKLGDLQASLAAYVNCCDINILKLNACYNAGRLYEQMGDTENAIKYYLLSKWETSIEKGRSLRELVAGGG